MWYTNGVSSSSFLEQFPQSYWEAVSLGYSPQEGIDMYTWLYLNWITNKDLLHSIGNCNNLIGKTIWKRTDICIGITESLCCTPETNTTLLINYAAAAAAKSLQSCPTLCDPHRRQPTRLPVPGILKARTGVGCHFLLQCIKVKSEVAQLCLTLSNSMDCSPPGSSIHRIFQARVLQWGAIIFSN